MAARNEPATAPAERELVITRVFDAPRDLVWLAWTDPKHVAQWWGPRGFTTRVTELDLRPGGSWRYVMIGPDGTEYPVKGVFREVVPLERIVTTDEFDEGFEQVITVDLPRGVIATAIFEDGGGKTKLTLRIMHSTAEDRRKHEEMGVVAGWNSSFECLEEHLRKVTGEKSSALTLTLPSDREIRLTRVFDAPRRLVFEAFSKPEHLRRWWGCRSFTMTICEMDFRLGGAWRFVLRAPDGQEFPFKGVYREIVPPERLVYTFVYDVEGVRDHAALETLTFDERDGKTTLTAVVLHQTVEARDGHLQSGMEAGAAESYDRLAELLRTMA